ncbi:MAG: hypothetical protein SPL08_02925 [Pseudomonadota bacterium]|nr:hypothetical protein [Pseudomonadota bacterium]
MITLHNTNLPKDKREKLENLYASDKDIISVFQKMIKAGISPNTVVRITDEDGRPCDSSLLRMMNNRRDSFLANQKYEEADKMLEVMGLLLEQGVDLKTRREVLKNAAITEDPKVIQLLMEDYDTKIGNKYYDGLAQAVLFMARKKEIVRSFFVDRPDVLKIKKKTVPGKLQKILSLASKEKALNKASEKQRKTREDEVAKAEKAGKPLSKEEVKKLRDAEGRARAKAYKGMLEQRFGKSSK